MLCIRVCTIDAHTKFCFEEKRRWQEVWNMWFPSARRCGTCDFLLLVTHVHIWSRMSTIFSRPDFWVKQENSWLSVIFVHHKRSTMQFDIVDVCAPHSQGPVTVRNKNYVMLFVGTCSHMIDTFPHSLTHCHRCCPHLILQSRVRGQTLRVCITQTVRNNPTNLKMDKSQDFCSGRPGHRAVRCQMPPM